MSTIAFHALSECLINLFPNTKPKILTDPDGNIEEAKVFVTEKITYTDCESLLKIAADHELDFAIKSTGATHGILVKFNK
ncbi:hypothetical protein KO504_16860 [Winogradskyella psychrotolerans]|uniref:hypothetical protein n=1 Tax=Winogradskyella psychrotolerans TaxID=1344585 RepID=UPI001C06E254|nr:hypothetical protein [Winogradskyella psychrotolerans]MBU2923022.1 hypothetical protein [Winogradskyella psychrotolerans]